MAPGCGSSTGPRSRSPSPRRRPAAGSAPGRCFGWAALRAGHRILAELRFPVSDKTVASHLSGGNRQKLNLALALLGEADVLLLDEPYQGFDYGTYVNFWDLVDAWRAAGRVVVVVTHMLAELTRVDQVVELPPPHTPPSGQPARRPR